MKLYLSAYQIPDSKAFSNFIKKAPPDIKIGLILNANDYKTPDERKIKAQELLKYFSSLGFAVDEIDLRGYVKDNSNLLRKIQEFDVVWLNGGNTYRLRWILAQCDGEHIIREALKSGVIYGGDSAGAIVAGPTLEYFDSADDPTKAEKVIYEGWA